MLMTVVGKKPVIVVFVVGQNVVAQTLLPVTHQLQHMQARARMVDRFEPEVGTNTYLPMNLNKVGNYKQKENLIIFSCLHFQRKASLSA